MADPIKPDTRELARPESIFGTAASATNPYLNVLTPEDAVLQSRGGIENLKIYKELLRDDQVASTFQQRRLALTSKETEVEAGGDDPASEAAAEALREDLAELPWDNITDKMLYASFYGWSVAEVLWAPGEGRVKFANIIVRDRSRFRFGRSGALYLLERGQYIEMPERKFWTLSTGADHDDEPYGLGLAHSLYWPVYFKRNDIKFWLIFLEKFGQPTALAKIPAGQIDDPDVRARALAMLRSIATDSGVVVPDNVVPELLEAARSGAADYDTMKRAMDSAIAKIVLSQTMTTDNGSSRSQAEVHSGIRDEVVAADSDLICESFNRGPVKWWSEWNFPGAKPPRIYRRTEPDEDLNARAERDNKILTLGYEPTEVYIEQTYGEGWTKKAPPPAPIAGPQGVAIPGQQQPDPANFGEREAAAFSALKAARRADQDALLEAAANFAEQYDTILGKRVGQLLQAAEFAEDYDTFRRNLDEIIAEDPAPETVDKLQRASVFARLMGAFRAAR